MVDYGLEIRVEERKKGRKKEGGKKKGSR